MKTTNYIKLGLATAVAGSLVSAYILLDNTAKYTPRTGEVENEMEEAAGANQYWFNMRKNPQTGQLDYNAIAQAQEEVALSAAAANKANAFPLSWKELGPDNVGGRTRAILLDLINDPTGNTLFAGGVAGGLWKSTTAGGSWVKINDFELNLAVSCIAEDANGIIYYGTGEGFCGFEGISGGMIGGGIFKADNTAGTTFTRLTSTKPTVNTDAGWAIVNDIEIDPNNPQRIYASTKSGLQVSSNGGTAWVLATGAIGSQGQDIEVGSDGSVIFSNFGKGFISSNGTSFTGISGAGNNKLPTSAVRTEFAIAPSDDNRIYAWCAAANGSLVGSYYSTDKGVTWTKTVAGGGAFDPFAVGDNFQGSYDNILGVHPKNKNIVFGGGADLYAYDFNAQQNWTQISAYQGGNGYPLYVHPDKHEIIWSIKDTNIVYFGSDGGVAKTQNGGATFSAMNRNYNTVQFYAIGFAKTGEVIGGSQDNGTSYINYLGNTAQTAQEIKGGDGGYGEISQIYPAAFFAESQYGSMQRSSNKGTSFADCYSLRCNASVSGAPFVTPFELWESLNDQSSPDSIAYITPVNIPSGTVLNVSSKTNSYPLVHTTNQSYLANDTVWVKDIVQSKFAIGLNNSIWLAKNITDFSSDPSWIKIASDTVFGTGLVYSIPDKFSSGDASCMAFSQDGNHLYAGAGGALYRISNLNTIRNNRLGDTLTGEVGYASSQVTCTQIAGFTNAIAGIGVDANDAGKVIVCLAGYDGNTNNHIWYSTTADTDPHGTVQSNSFTAKGGSGATKLPGMPVYDAVIDFTGGKKVVAGTDFGIYYTSDITVANPVWVKDLTFPNAPVTMVRQQHKPWNWPGLTNTGVIYASTYGRGFWSTASLMGVKENDKNAVSFKSSITVYPNPAKSLSNVNFTLNETSNVTLQVLDIQGKLVKSVNLGTRTAGNNTYKFINLDLQQGTYFISMLAGTQKAVAKFIVLE